MQPSYLEFQWYKVEVTHSHELIKEVCYVIHGSKDPLDNIKIDTSEEGLLRLSEEWSLIQRYKYGQELTTGVILAGDGLFVRTSKLEAEDVPKWKRRLGFRRSRILRCALSS